MLRTLSRRVDDPRIRLVRALNETQQSARRGPAGPGEEKYIETLVVVDPKMTNFHGEDAAKQYALSACNIVSDLISQTDGDTPGLVLVYLLEKKSQCPRDGLQLADSLSKQFAIFKQSFLGTDS